MSCVLCGIIPGRGLATACPLYDTWYLVQHAVNCKTMLLIDVQGGGECYYTSTIRTRIKQYDLKGKQPDRQDRQDQTYRQDRRTGEQTDRQINNTDRQDRQTHIQRRTAKQTRQTDTRTNTHVNTSTY